jgi:CRISPR-associated protein Csm5
VNYRVTCLTPTLVGDGQRLSPIDYMVWKDQVNVLDQHRIFKLLAKGPRLDGYLAQLKRAEKLDFASWGGFAQNFAGRRIPFDHPALTKYWERAHAADLFIPTFAVNVRGPYLPATSLKGALRTATVHARWSESALRGFAARAEGERSPRRVTLSAEESVLGGPGASVMRAVAAGDSDPAAGAMKIYLVRTATLTRRGDRLELAWKVAGRGSVEARRVEDATPLFAEMAAPGTTFAGAWREKTAARESIFRAANDCARAQLERHAAWAGEAGLPALAASLQLLRERAAAMPKNACVLPVGWGGGLLSKSAWLDTANESYRSIASAIPFYARALATGLPFPKTRRIVFAGNQPSALAGWVQLEVG